ncbi:MAG: hypothetical protein HGB12_06880, partial [Bacteroidetes bacterium]|nr:hypothetical protein [Bacteroidota bacterium]
MKKCKSTFGLNLCMGAFFTCFTFIFFLSLTLSLSMCAFNSFAQSGWTYEQKFNSLNDGNLAGQDGWVNRRSTVASVGNYGPYEGAKNVQMPIAQDLVTEYSRDISPVSDGIVYVAIKKSSTTVSQYIFFQNVYNDYCFVLAYGLGQNNNNIKICDKNTSVCETVLSGGANDVNYVVAIEFDGALDRVRAKVLNGESWSAWTNWVSTVFTTVGTIDLYSNGTTGGAFAYVDTF